jgi:hypothetical protein
MIPKGTESQGFKGSSEIQKNYKERIWKKDNLGFLPLFPNYIGEKPHAFIFPDKISIITLCFCLFLSSPQFLFGDDVPDHSQYFPFLIRGKNTRVNTMFHGLFYKVAMVLVTKQDGITTGASYINS